ncbi:MAG TPA: hypothetical protein VG435_09820 [Acidimicrobiales bacterium]|jgi:hypothetical protein|nr:hypothetical protein [Acidimicrobiales bacterium]
MNSRDPDTEPLGILDAIATFGAVADCLASSAHSLGLIDGELIDVARAPEGRSVRRIDVSGLRQSIEDLAIRVTADLAILETAALTT